MTIVYIIVFSIVAYVVYRFAMHIIAIREGAMQMMHKLDGLGQVVHQIADKVGVVAQSVAQAGSDAVGATGGAVNTVGGVANDAAHNLQQMHF